MEFVVDLAILIVVCGIALLLFRTKLRVCPHCASLFVDRPGSGVYPPQPWAAGQPESSPFLDLPFTPEPSLVVETPLVVETSIAPASNAPASNAPAASASGDTLPALTESADDFPVIETHEPVEMPAFPGNLMTPPSQILESGEILIEPEAEEELGLLPIVDEANADDASGEFMFEKDIGIGPRGLPLAARLIDAGFEVTMTPQKWGGSRGGRRRPAPSEPDEQ